MTILFTTAPLVGILFEVLRICLSQSRRGLGSVYFVHGIYVGIIRKLILIGYMLAICM